MFNFAHFLVIGWMFTAGWVPMDQSSYTKFTQAGNVTYSSQDTYAVNNAAHVGMEFNALFIDHINVHSSVDSWQYPITLDDWAPYRVKYDVGMDLSLYRFNNQEFNVILSIDRYCSHPIEAWNSTNGHVNEAYCECSISVKGNFDVF